MRRILTCALLLAALSLCLADTPFPNKGKNAWVFKTMWAIKRDHLWYRIKDNVPRRPIPTRADLGTKTLYLALDSQGVVDSFTNLVAMSKARPADAQSKKWANQFRASLPKKKAFYLRYLQRVSRLFNFFRPEIQAQGKRMKLDVGALAKRLRYQQKQVEAIR